MTKLIEILKKETEGLKNQYIDMSKKWATISFNNMVQSDFLYQHESGKYFKNRYGKTRSEDSMINNVATIVNAGVESYVSKIEKQAKEHYETSIAKLAERIKEKGLDQDKIKASTSHVGVNIETTLTDGNKTVRAFTIIASGEVQKPHYRYLIK